MSCRLPSDCSVSLLNFRSISIKELAISGSWYIGRLHFFPRTVLCSQIINSIFLKDLGTPTYSPSVFMFNSLKVLIKHLLYGGTSLGSATL